MQSNPLQEGRVPIFMYFQGCVVHFQKNEIEGRKGVIQCMKGHHESEMEHSETKAQKPRQSKRKGKSYFFSEIQRRRHMVTKKPGRNRK